MTRSAQRAAPGARLLLLAALLLGIVTMHTLGHPAESHALEDVSPAHSVASAGVSAPAAHGGTRHTPAPAPAVDVAMAPATAWAYPMPATGMDPMSVCLAVLAGLVVLLIGTGRAGSRGAAPLGGAARIVGRSGGGPDPPSPRELLTRLAVLRI
ncbi:hypothetical protein ACGFZK_19180 [Streptomyces sp. NPDC048257]|uniref:hypothetical protein n=1 Tax=Streptomyces sp. NPDC048257 TaxID=3365526 RepID=UPI0037114795